MPDENGIDAGTTGGNAVTVKFMQHAAGSGVGVTGGMYPVLLTGVSTSTAGTNEPSNRIQSSSESFKSSNVDAPLLMMGPDSTYESDVVLKSELMSLAAGPLDIVTRQMCIPLSPSAVTSELAVETASTAT